MLNMTCPVYSLTRCQGQASHGRTDPGASPGDAPGGRGCGVLWSCPGLVLVPRRGGAVGVQDQCPAPPVNHHLMVEPAEKHTFLDAGRAAVGLVLGVVHLAGTSGVVAPPGPLAVLIPQHHGVAD